MIGGLVVLLTLIKIFSFIPHLRFCKAGFRTFCLYVDICMQCNALRSKTQGRAKCTKKRDEEKSNGEKQKEKVERRAQA